MIALFMVLILYAPGAPAQSPGKTVLDGVYSEPQATRGAATYTAVCSACHGNALEGVSAPPLEGNRFVERWREGMLDSLFGFIRDRMPLGRAPGATPIPDSGYLDILVYILKVNGYRAGPSELTHDVLKDVMLVGKNGPQPVPDGSLIVTVGCLSQTPDGVWVLMNAAEPVRTRSSVTSTPAELQTSAQRSLGTLVFRLADLDAVSDFAPDAHKEHKMQAKGYLVRQPNAERINLSSMAMLDSACVR